ncbi:MAG: transposase [Acidobacteria bacterium]|nr:transposase [Acidobacteriota bacterium]
MNLSEMPKQKTLSTEEKCIAYLEKMRWPDGVRCPTCGNSSISRFRTKGKSGKIRHLYQCLGKACRYQFSPTTGTIFHDSHLPLNKWFEAIALVCDADKPMSANQLRLALGVQYKTAAHLVARIRQAIERGTIELAGEPAVGQGEQSSTKPTMQPMGAANPTAGRSPQPLSLAQRRTDTANLLNHIAAKPGTESVSSTAVDNMLSMFVSLAQITVRPPLFFVNYLKGKVFT